MAVRLALARRPAVLTRREARNGLGNKRRVDLQSAAGCPAKPNGSPRAKGARSFEIDAFMLAEEARFDGIFVLRTNAKVTPLQAVLRYRDLLQVEDLFRRTKAIMRTRPIFHSPRRHPRPCLLLLPG